MKKIIVSAACAAVLAACGGSSSKGEPAPASPQPPVTQPPVTQPPVTEPPQVTQPPVTQPPVTQEPPPNPPVGPVLQPPYKSGAWTFYAQDQGLSTTVHDASADEAGNVYVAGEDALYVKTRDEAGFRRFDGKNGGLTENCYGSTEAERQSLIEVAAPTVPKSLCPVISVAGAEPGKAFVGFKGVGEDDDGDAKWAIFSGGLDVVRFDGTNLSRERHVLVASPPGYVCEEFLCLQKDPADPGGCLLRAEDRCSPWGTWTDGRMKGRQIQRVIVNRTAGRGKGDAIFGGKHGAFSVLVANPEQRDWEDYTKGDPAWADAKLVFEHQHPATTLNGVFLTGETWAHAVDPRTGIPWFANQFQTTNLPGYVSMAKPSVTRPVPHEPYWGNMTKMPRTVTNPDGTTRTVTNFIQFFGTDGTPTSMDAVQSLSFCDDGTLWVGSYGRGLARVRLDANRTLPADISRVSVKGAGAGFDDVVLAVACDPSDDSVWVGLGWTNRVSQILRLKGGQWSMVPVDAPAFAKHGPVRSIQIDRWSTPRTVYFAHEAWSLRVAKRDASGQVVRDASGAVVQETITGPGGLTAYSGP